MKRNKKVSNKHFTRIKPCEVCARGKNERYPESCRCLAWQLWFALEWANVRNKFGKEADTEFEIIERYRKKSKWKGDFLERVSDFYSLEEWRNEIVYPDSRSD